MFKSMWNLISDWTKAVKAAWSTFWVAPIIRDGVIGTCVVVVALLSFIAVEVAMVPMWLHIGVEVLVIVLLIIGAWLLYRALSKLFGWKLGKV